MNNKYLLEIKNLCKNYTNENNSKIEIIKNLNFQLKQNTKVSIVGPSGSGKTTFLNIIGLLDSEYYGNFYFKINDNQVTEIIDVPSTGSWTDWSFISIDSLVVYDSDQKFIASKNF